MIKHLKKTSLLLTSLLLLAGMSAPAQGATTLSKTQQTKVSAVFKAITSSDPDSMNKKKKNLSGSAELAVSMIQNYYSTEKYMRSISTMGRPLGNTPANAAVGSAKITNGKVVLTTSAPGFSGTYSDFKFNKAGKITSWSIASTGGSKVSIASRVKSLPKVTWQYANDIKAVYWGKGVQMDSGTIYQDSLGQWIIQLAVTNVAGGNNTKSLISTTGKYQSPDKKLFATTSSPVGCFETGQTVYFTSVVPTGAVILSGVKGLLEVPMSNGCEEDDSNRLEVTIKP